MKLWIVALMGLLVNVGLSWGASAPEPAFQVTAKVDSFNGKTMNIELITIGKCVRPGMYGSYMKDKFKDGDKLIVTVVDKDLKTKAGNVIEGILERVTDAKGQHNELSKINLVANSLGQYRLRDKFQKDTRVLKAQLYGTGSN